MKVRDLQIKGSCGFVWNAMIQGLGFGRKTEGFEMLLVGQLLVELHRNKTSPGSSILKLESDKFV